MRFDIEHLKHLAERLDYKPDSQQHKDNLAEYCNSDRMIAFAEAFRALEQEKEAAERERDEAVMLRLEVSGSLSSATIRYETAEAKLAELEKQDPYLIPNLEHFVSFWRKVDSGDMKPGKNEISHTLWLLESLAKTELFTRPAPAINLAELVPVEGFLEDSSDGSILTWQRGWNACRAAIMRNMEGAK